MAIDFTGIDIPIKPQFVTIKVEQSHPLLLLADTINWRDLSAVITEDLKSSTDKGFWFLGRKINVRIHLAAFLLQYLYNLTDRKTEYSLKDNAAFQCFCGSGIISSWHAPDHTKIAKFRSRLSPETQRHLVNAIAKQAVNLGFADPSQVDLDSTAQEANIAYPSDAQLMTKLSGLGKKVIDYFKTNLPELLPENLKVDMKKIKTKAKEYFFLAKNKSIEIKRNIFKQLHSVVKKELHPLVTFCESLDLNTINSLPWNIRSAFDTVKNDAWRYILDVAHFVRTHKIKPGKLLSFHARSVECIKKGKVGKDKEFGRVFQLGRIAGNFMFALESTSIKMNDKESFIPFVTEHQNIFGEGVLQTIATDKGYWTGANKNQLTQLNITTAGMQKPSNLKQENNDPELEEALHDRRAGIEPLIGHVKMGGQLGKSRMKSDTATLAAGYSSVLGFNLRQMIRCRQGKLKIAA